MAGDKDAGASAEKVFVIENFAKGSKVARIEHNPQTGRVRLLNKRGKLLKEKLLDACENGRPTQDRFAEKYYSISPLMGSKERYNIMYTDTYTIQSGTTYDVNKDYGGALFDAEANNIVISPTPTSGTVITMALQNEYIKQTTTTNLFHEFGEVNQGVNQYRGGAIDYENTIRRILKMQPRPYDIYHQPRPVTSTR